MSGFVSVGYTPQRTDICAVADMSKMLARHVGDILLSRPFFVVGIILVRPAADTHSCMQVGISTNEVVT